MAAFLENLSLDVFMGTEEELQGFVAHAATNGKGVVGYSGYPYINMHYGWAQLILATRMNEQEKKLEVVGFDTHADGHSIWTVAINKVLEPEEDEEESVKRLLVRRCEDRGGMAIINVVNADILPSFLEDDVYDFQMIAFPKYIEYFATEDDYNNSLKKDDLGRTFGVADGAVFPSGFLKNRNPHDEEYGKNNWMDDYTLVRGTVKKLYPGKLQFGEEEFTAYVRCIIDTEFGELEINHSFKQVKEEQQDHIKVGATVFAVCVLSGDPAIREYTEGIIKDEEHHLMLLRHAIVTGEAERLKYMLAAGAEYVSELSKATYHGADDIISRLKYVHKESKYNYHAHMATISSIDEGETILSYAEGKRCLVLAAREPDDYESIVFVDVNEEGLITRILITPEGRYHFRIDNSKCNEMTYEDIELQKTTYSHAILMRARFFNFLEYEEEDEAYMGIDDCYARDMNNAKLMLSAWPEEIQKWEEKRMEYLFGYLFAKAIEESYADNSRNEDFSPMKLVSYHPAVAWEGEFDSQYEGDLHSRLEIAMKYGRQYSKDFMLNTNFEEADYGEELKNALILVQRIGRRCAKEYMTK